MRQEARGCAACAAGISQESGQWPARPGLELGQVVGALGSALCGFGSDPVFDSLHDSARRLFIFRQVRRWIGLRYSGTRSFWSLSGQILSVWEYPPTLLNSQVHISKLKYGPTSSVDT